MARRKKSRKRSLSGRAALVVAALLVLGIAAILALSYAGSPRGNVFLLDLGFAGRYERVQDTIDAALGAALRDLGLDKDVKETTKKLSVGGREFHRRDWVVPISKGQSATQVNIALTAAVGRAGGVVRSSKETTPGSVTLEAGSRRYATHLIRITGPEAPQAGKAPHGGASAGGPDTGETGAPRPSKEGRSPAGGRARIALVIDDFGYSRDATVEEFLRARIPLTVSVIPELPFTTWAVRRAAEEGKEAILHLPMEAETFTSDVPAVLTSMTDAEIASLVVKYLADTPGVAGVNNHLGSVATQDSRVMSAVMGVLRPRRLFFLDSLTSSKSVAYTSAKSSGVPAARNDLFIDADTEDPGVVDTRLDRLLEIAMVRGYAIGIGHPRPWTWTAVAAFEERIKGSGVELVFLSDLVE
jgi:polysaccharide deacetylase 2 family uncharacterized protein YibQ